MKITTFEQIEELLWKYCDDNSEVLHRAGYVHISITQNQFHRSPIDESSIGIFQITYINISHEEDIMNKVDTLMTDFFIDILKPFFQGIGFTFFQGIGFTIINAIPSEVNYIGYQENEQLILSMGDNTITTIITNTGQW